MAKEKSQISQKGYNKVLEELREAKTTRREEIAQKIKEAREQGDLSENSEYEAAMEEQGHLEARIKELEDILENAVVVDIASYDADTIGIGSTVVFADLTNGRENKYTIVGANEANILLGLISNESPVGRALIGAKVGDHVSAETPAGIVEIEVKEVTREE